MLKSVICGGALAALSAIPAFAQAPAGAPSSTSTVPAANIGATIGADASMGAPGSLGGSVTGSPITPGAPMSANPGVTGSVPPSTPAAPAQSSTSMSSQGAMSSAAASNGVDASASAVAPSPSTSPIFVGATVKSQSGVAMGTIDRLIPGPNGYVSGVVLRTASGTLRETPMTALGTTDGVLVTTYNSDQINALPEAKPAQ